MITLRNVVDIRSGQYHSIVIVKARNARYFVPAEEWDDGEEEPI